MDDATEFREALAEAGLTQSGMARWMMAHGDTRTEATVLRGLNRLATGKIPMSGEMRVVLHLMNRMP